MLISQTAEYALRATVYLADVAGAARTNQQIADATRVPVGYLSKVLQALSRAGILRAQRGLHGGFTLAREAGELSVWDVIQAVDPLQRIHECPLGLKAHGANLCPMHRRLDDAMAMVEQAFRGSSLAELLAEPASSKPLCEFPSKPAKFVRPKNRAE